MALNDILTALGVDRVIWVDDIFGEPEEDLAILAREQPDIASAFPELNAAFALQGFGDVDEALTEAIAKLNENRLMELRAALLQADAESTPTQELGRGAIATACLKLGVSKADRWTFEQADGQLAGDHGDDTKTAYVIDLKEAGGEAQRGLDILKLLLENQSKGVAFILTHETASVGEADLEKKLTHDLGVPTGPASPITVISKERLTEEGANIESALAIALKRSGLRRALHSVLTAASRQAGQAFASTATSLLEIDPERLERYVYERGRMEGVSELNVVERALSAGASKSMRAFFGTDPIVLGAIQALRALQSVELDHQPADAGSILGDLRDAEVWDEGPIVNVALSPLANGDVFRFDDREPNIAKSPRLFVLLGQPCDVMLRPDGKRVSEVAMLVPLIELQDDGTPLPDANDPDENDADKKPELPFRVQGKRYKLNLESLAYVRTAILDLASFRADGCVSVHAGHLLSTELLSGGKAIYAARTAAADTALAAPPPAPPVPGIYTPADDRLLLTLSDGKPWDKVRMGTRLAPYAPPQGHHLQALPDRVSWFLRREGRIRAPYSSFLLERALRRLGRRAFDLDFTT